MTTITNLPTIATIEQWEFWPKKILNFDPKKVLNFDKKIMNVNDREFEYSATLAQKKSHPFKKIIWMVTFQNLKCQVNITTVVWPMKKFTKKKYNYA